jgi:hypothetical protein
MVGSSRSGLAQGASPGATQNQPAPAALPDTPVPQSDVAKPTAPEGLQPFSASAPVPPPPVHFWTNPDPDAQVTVFEDTRLRVLTDQALSSRQTRAGEALTFTLNDDVVVDNTLVVPRGATVHGTVVESKHAGALSGSPDLILKLTSLEFGGRSYPLYTYQFKVVGASKTRPAEVKVRGGAVIGAIAGGIFNGSAKGGTTAVGKLAGMGTGAALGAGVGAAAAAVTPGPIVSIPAESEMDFYLSSPISVVPVREKEASRLSEGLHHGGAVLYVRGETP